MKAKVPPGRDLRLVAVATTLPGRVGDGTPEFVLTLATAMTGSTIDLVAPRIRGGELLEDVDGVTIHRVAYARDGRERLAEDAILPTLRRDPMLIRQLPRLVWGLYRTTRRLTREHGADALHAHWIVPGGVLALLAGRRTTPFFVTVHGADAHALNGRFGTFVKRTVLRRALGVYPVSQEIADLVAPLTRPGGLGPTFPMGVDITVLREGAGAMSPVPGRVLFVGRLSDKKGVDVLLEAVALSAAVREVHIVGDGPDRSDLEELVDRLEIADRVVFVGHADRATVLAEYREAAVVALPSVTGSGGDRDGTPVVLMEAMALGLPVVASALGGMADEVSDRDNGLTVTPGDVTALSAALDAFITDGDLAERLGTRARSHAEAHFDIHRIAAALEADVADRLSRISGER